MDFYDHKTEMQKKEYNLKCKVVRKKVNFHDDAYAGNSEANLVILVPYEGMERDMFMSAYYQDAIPVKNGEGHLTSKVELPSFVGGPCSMPSMLRLQWPTKYYEYPHLLVMSYSMESLLNTYKNIETIELRIYPVDKMDELGLSDGVMRI